MCVGVFVCTFSMRQVLVQFFLLRVPLAPTVLHIAIGDIYVFVYLFSGNPYSKWI